MSIYGDSHWSRQRFTTKTDAKHALKEVAGQFKGDFDWDAIFDEVFVWDSKTQSFHWHEDATDHQHFTNILISNSYIDVVAE